jgi:uncharacterized protein DUF87
MISGRLLIVDRMPAWWAPRAYPTHTPEDPRTIADVYRERATTLWTLLGTCDHPVRFLLGSDGDQVTCGFAPADNVEAARLVEAFDAVMPGVEFREMTADVVRREWPAVVCASGVPGVNAAFPPTSSDQLLRSCNGKRFLMYVESRRAPFDWVARAVKSTEDQLREVEIDRMRRVQDPGLERHRNALVWQLERYRQARTGCLQTFLAVLAEDSDTSLLARSALEAGWVDHEPSRPPIVWHDFDGTKRWNSHLPSEVAEVAHFPLRSYSGYEVTAASLAASTPTQPAVERGEPWIGLGDSGATSRGPAQILKIPLRQVYQHIGVFGATGSGKTNALMSILIQLWVRHKVPFLVIEPSIKREFRSLLNESWADGLQLFSVGDSRCRLRLNLLQPFGVPLFTHLAFLKSLLLAVYAWVPPQQYLLERALIRVYEDRGFDVATGVNQRGRGRSMWPALSDLYATIPSVVKESGYDSNIARNLIAGLQARIGCLCRGPLGAVLNSRRSTPLPQLLSRPAVVELALLGSDEDRALLMGVLLMALAEHRMSSGAVDPGHLLVIEEAHRLLRNTSTAQFDEVANNKAQALESFANLISELRAFRQGIAVVEQDPKLLHPSVISNTNVKLCLRLADADGIDLMARNLSMDRHQSHVLGDLPVGSALVHIAGSSGAHRVRLPHIPLQTVSRERLEECTRRLQPQHVGFLSGHGDAPPVAGHQCPGEVAANLRTRIAVVALACMAGAVVGDSVDEILKAGQLGLKDIPAESAACLFQSTAEQTLCGKGIEGSLPLETEDELNALWRRLIGELVRVPPRHVSAVELLAHIQRRTYGWCKNDDRPETPFEIRSLAALINRHSVSLTAVPIASVAAGILSRTVRQGVSCEDGATHQSSAKHRNSGNASASAAQVNKRSGSRP